MPAAGTIKKLTKDLIGYKKCKDIHRNVFIVTLLIPKGAYMRKNKAEPEYSDKGNHGTSTFKRRCSKARVLSVIDIDSWEENESQGPEFWDYVEHNHCYGHSGPMKYEVGKWVKPEGKEFCMLEYEDCAAGIHFFIHPENAVDY